VAVRLRELIVSGHLAPGTPLAEADLAKRLGVSRTSVRVALDRLQQDRLVAVRTGRPVRPVVAPLAAEDADAICLLLGSLEGLAAGIAAVGPDGWRRQVVSRLRWLSADLVEAAAGGHAFDLRRAYDAHAGWHRSLAEQGAGPRLQGELRALRARVCRYERLATPLLVRDVAALRDAHEAVAEAIEAGDAERAAEHVERHWMHAGDAYRQVVAVVGPWGDW